MSRIPIIILLLATQWAYALDVIAHRGYACSNNENSIESVQRAWRAGADAVEVDVRVSGDGIVYLFHDDEISNTKIDGLAFSRINTLSAMSIPTLPELLDNAVPSGYYVFDLKTDDIDDVDKILDVVRDSGIDADSVSFQSRSIDVLEYIGHRMPSARQSFLTKLKWKVPYLIHPSASQLAKTLEGRDIDRVSMKGRTFIDRRFVDIVKATGREVHVWTINDPKRAAHYRTLGVDGLITDRVEGLFSENDASAYEHRDCAMTVADAS